MRYIQLFFPMSKQEKYKVCQLLKIYNIDLMLYTFDIPIFIFIYVSFLLLFVIRFCLICAIYISKCPPLTIYSGTNVNKNMLMMQHHKKSLLFFFLCRNDLSYNFFKINEQSSAAQGTGFLWRSKKCLQFQIVKVWSSDKSDCFF